MLVKPALVGLGLLVLHDEETPEIGLGLRCAG